MSFAARTLEQTLVYRAWETPFVQQKFAPILAHNSISRVRPVLDVACGLGTNTKYFSGADYLGIDFNERYIGGARRRHGRKFLTADARTYVAPPENGFDFILVNSFLHDLDTKEMLAILSHLKSLLTEDGHIHMLELVLPKKPGIARLLARWNRGKFVRPRDEWRRLFDQLFVPVVFQPYRITGMGTSLWEIVDFKGKQ